ncbi:Dam family site-specific DNA-(adenine-N6)-methyltransferase [Salmonella enterica]|uniref:Site-specific DNA-methyltransferase (adenine-specific) n=1 Tax=Salmonella enterica TaxID=28901 RepID=A0A5U2FBP8_SALER|nr:Dam family site-specific DNA-(adenine-N6)-methyltransferase [Salmonella enterica]EBQ8821181.1 adenine methylase [Salmonella enterica subsp. enterica serovar Kisarawe]EDV0905398.1 Dam family site-specific DNA-(adenine-N6)-methyltransferase [Salmonella enterica subsp. salamae]EDV5493811.1 Dam family site-specific DNA-(adenine-N6)-methyltransferase [Salmonella enterica subsp. enterica]ECU8779058.1 Dam family site-specific DNA-(adenine-N6)-methyltransferase [Salmonella enterica]
MKRWLSSPLIWAGSKYRTLNRLLNKDRLPRSGGCLVEPFVGSGTVFLNTDYQRYVLCDTNEALINFFTTLTVCTEELISEAAPLFSNTNSELYYQHRKEFNDTALKRDRNYEDCLRLAALFLYLNHHGFNGVWRVSKKSGFNVPFRKKTRPFPEEDMRQFAEKARRTRAEFLCVDFRHTLRAQYLLISPDTVIYCDPPYLPKSKTADFRDYTAAGFTPDDHRELVSLLLDVNQDYGAKVVISNSDTKETREIYAPFRLHRLKVHRSVSANGQRRGTADEVIGVLKDGKRCVSAPRRAGKTTAIAQCEDALW